MSDSIRKGKIDTLHGDINYPAFMPDATYGTVKNTSFVQLKSAGINELVTTTLHIEQKIGSEYLRDYGGIHKFTGWDRPVLTDSGGFQVFSLIHRRANKQNKITDAGCSFIDPITGKYNFLSPESSQVIQHNIGSDIRVVLDEPLIESDSLSSIKRSVSRTTEWAKRSKKAFLNELGLSENDFDNPDIKRPLLVAVIQGANNMEYRKRSAMELMEIGFDIYGLGGMPLKTKKTWDLTDQGGFHKELLHFLAELIPQDKIRYALGVGTPDDLIFCVNNGWDIFDTVLPTRNARHGYLYVHKGEGDASFEHYDVLHIKSERYKFDDRPIDSQITYPGTENISRAYLRYLIKNKSAIGHQYATLHNLGFYGEVMSKLRSA